jgi:hypothetical protein
MPRDLIIVSARAPRFEDLVAAARSEDPTLIPVRSSGGAVVRLVGPALAPVLSVQYSLAVHVAEEIERLAPEAVGRVAIPASWTEAWAPWGPEGDVGVRIARELAERCDGVCLVEDGTR